jgi:serine protease
MKKMILFALMLCCMASAMGNVPSAVTAKYGKLTELQRTWWDSGVEMMPNQLIIKYKDGANRSAASAAMQKLNIVSETPMFPMAETAFRAARQTAMNDMRRSERERDEISKIDLTRIYSVTFSAFRDAREVALEVSTLPEVEYAEPRFVRSISYTPNDPQTGSLYWVNRISATQAWDVTQGDTSVVIGIVDSGVQWDHPDIFANMKRNWAEIPNNNIDDDNNGFIDDLYGWNFSNNTNDPREASPTHGTHVGGIAAAVTDNNVGVPSIGFKSKLQAINAATPGNPTGVQFGYEGITYAANNGCKIINCSWGGTGGSVIEQEVINYATLVKGALVVAACGNNGTDADITKFFPSAYQYVLAVANTGSTDARNSTSNFGTQFVDVSAPGTGINATWQSNTYANLSGTSMASPMTAGLAALVRFKNPTFTPEQVAEQVRVTADNINAANPSLANKMGKGRINAFRALTDSVSPSIRMINFGLIDRDDFPDSNDTIRVRVRLKNYLRNASGVTLTLQPVSTTNITLLNATANLGNVNALQERLDSSLSFIVSPSATQGSTVDFLLRITAAGGYEDYARFIVTLKPTFRTLALPGNLIQTTINNRGLIGFNDFPTNSQGVGFRYRGANLLFEGAVAFGYSAARYVDVARDAALSGSQNTDFTSNLPVTINQPGAQADLQVDANFTDANAPAANRIGLAIRGTLLMFGSAADTGYALFVFRARNTSASAISNLHAGMFFDWDIPETGFTNNLGGYDATRKLAYVFNPTTQTYAGSAVLEGTASFDVEPTTANPTRAQKFGFISNGIGTIPTAPADVYVMVGGGPFNVPVGGTALSAFVMTGGRSLAEIQQHTTAAIAKWNTIRNAFLNVERVGNTLPTSFALAQNFPNPFNPSTVINYQLPISNEVKLEVFDVLGRKVSTLVDARQAAGAYKVNFNAAGLSSGTYFYRLQAGSFVETKKMLLVK